MPIASCLRKNVIAPKNLNKEFEMAITRNKYMILLAIAATITVIIFYATTPAPPMPTFNSVGNSTMTLSNGMVAEYPQAMEMTKNGGTITIHSDYSKISITTIPNGGGCMYQMKWKNFISANIFHKDPCSINGVRGKWLEMVDALGKNGVDLEALKNSDEFATMRDFLFEIFKK